jgi:hypothetical protein
MYGVVVAMADGCLCPGTNRSFDLDCRMRHDRMEKEWYCCWLDARPQSHSWVLEQSCTVH